MASEDEDVDLQALRNAVLATLKSSPVRSKDEDDLEVLRRAALSSKKSIEKKLNNLSCYDGHSKIKSHQHTDMICWRRPNSNLIEIQTLPIEESPINRVYHGTFRPINSTPLIKEEPSTQPKDTKPKRSSKFSRFESDSDSDSDSNYDLVLTSPSSDSTKEDDTGSVLEMSQTQQEENSLDQTASQSSDKENEDNESVSSLNNCDDASKASKCDKNENAEGEQSAANSGDTTTRHQNATEEKMSDLTELDSDRARMEARKRKFESKQCVVLDKSKKISLKKIVASSKTDPVERKSNAEAEETPRKERNHRKHAEVASQSRTAGAASATIAFADTKEDLRVSLKQRREERKNGRRKRKRKEGSPSPSRVSPVLKSVLSIVKMEKMEGKKGKKEKRTERSRRNKNRKKSPSPHLNEGKSHQNGKKLPVRLRLGRPVTKKDEESDVDKPTTPSTSRKREKNRSVNSAKRSRKELSTGVSDPYPAGDYQFKVNYDLEAKIRRIREQNQAIMRRRDEVAADRKKHT